MKYEYLHFDGATFKRINKKRAETIYEKGRYVRLIAKRDVIDGTSNFLFDDVKSRITNGLFLSDLEYDSEDYRYWLQIEAKYTRKESDILYYIPIKLIDAFTSEAPTKYTTNTIETYDMDFFKFYEK